MGDDAEKIAELHAIVAAVQERVRSGLGRPVNGSGTMPLDSMPLIQVTPPDLMPLVHARDAAQAKIAAIGSLNPRAGGALNQAVQSVKKLIARSLQWFVRDQIIFNRETVAAMEVVMEALAEQNRLFTSLASQTNERFAAIHSLAAEARELKDVRSHWIAWRADWENKLATNEMQFLRNTADLQGAFQHRSTLIESNFREIVRAQHDDYLGALDRANVDIQKRLWADLEKVREGYERMIHSELRLIRLRAGQGAPAPDSGKPVASQPAPAAHSPSTLDYSRFAERFRGTDEEIRRSMQFYQPFFAGRHNVLDIGCGRGEFLEVMRESGVPARGIDLSGESVAQCLDKGLEADVADLFSYLAAQPDGEFDGILSSQVVEHLPPDRLPEMIRLKSAARSCGVAAFWLLRRRIRNAWLFLRLTSISIPRTRGLCPTSTFGSVWRKPV